MRIGVDLGGTKIEGVVMGAASAILARRRVATPAGDYDATLRAIADLVHRLEDDVGARGLPVGVAMPGSISPTSGLVRNANSTCLNGRALQADIDAALARPVRLANDANCMALSEARDGAGEGARAVFGVILGTGVGGGLVIDGQIVEGRNRVAGEWGHNPLPWPGPDEIDGPLCYCGQSGCIETWISGPGFAADFERRNGLALSPEEIVAQAQAGDASAGAAIETLAERLGKALALVVNILDPDVIVLAGGVSNIPALYALAPKALARHAFSDAVTTPIRKAAHGDASGVRGAAWLWPEA